MAASTSGVARRPKPAKSKTKSKAKAALLPSADWLVYILRCSDGTFYTGCTNDLCRRLRRHAQKSVKYTRGRLPVELAYKESAAGKGAALRREAAIKRLRTSGKQKLCDEFAAQERPC